MKNCAVNALTVFTFAAFIFFHSSFILAADLELGEYSSLSSLDASEISLLEQFRELFNNNQVSEDDIVKLKAALDPTNSGPAQEAMPLSADEELTPQKKPLLGEAQASYSELDPSVVEQLIEKITSKQLSDKEIASLRESLGLPNHLGSELTIERRLDHGYRHRSNSSDDDDCNDGEATCCSVAAVCCYIGIYIGVCIYGGT